MVDAPRPGWPKRAFGEQTDELREIIPVALARAHDRARAGHDITQATSRRVYGTALWEFQHTELAAAIAPVTGARIAKLGGYDLAVVHGFALFPLLYSDRAGVSIAHAKLPQPVSEQRERLFGAHGAELVRPQPYLDESWEGLERTERYDAFPELGTDTQLVVVAYACGLEAGLLHVEWGRAEHLGGGELLWGEHESLPLPGEPVHRDQLALLGAQAPTPRFDADAEPGIALGVRSAGTTPTGTTG